MSNLIEDIKTEEGFKGREYLDSLGKPTIGFGTLLPLDKKEAELLLEYRLNKFKSEVKSSLYDLDAPDEVWDILYHMAYQLGTKGLLQFKLMIKALRNKDYIRASKELKDSLWYRQTPHRAKRLIKRMESVA